MMFDQGRKKVQCILFAIAISLMVASPAFALFGGKVESFTADMVEIESNGKVMSTSKFYITPDAMRVDGMPGSGRGGAPQNISMLILKKEKKSYFYNHDKKLVFEAPADEKDFAAGYKFKDNIESEKILGKEKVAGYKCVKKEVVISMNVMGSAMKNKLTIWESNKFEMPLRTMDEDGAVQEMRNIKTGKPSKKYFRPLIGYKKVGNMMAALGMDIDAMMAKDMEEKEDAQARPKSAGAWGKKNKNVKQSSGQQNMENVDVNKIMEAMNQGMGENMSPEEKAEFMATMTHVMNRVKDTKEGPGAANKIWQFIPKRPGDKVGSELKTTHVLNVIMGTKASLLQVFDFYKNELTAKGWDNSSMYIQGGEGSISMNKGELRLSITSSKNPGMKGAYTLFYALHLNGPNL